MVELALKIAAFLFLCCVGLVVLMAGIYILIGGSALIGLLLIDPAHK